MRQRVTMGIPDEFMMVSGALREGVEIDRDVSIAEVEGEATQRLRGRAYRRRTARGGEGHTRTERETERTRRTKRDEHTTVTEVTPVPPVPPVDPVKPVVVTVTNNVPENLSIRVVSLEYDADMQQGTLVLEIERGSFRDAAKYIRKNFSELLRRKSPSGAARMPAGANLEIVSISINENDLCEVKFKVKNDMRAE